MWRYDKVKNKKRPFIIIVDDDADYREIVKKTLSSMAYDIKTMSTAKEVLTFIKKNDVDLVIADIRMADMDGFTLLKRIKKYSPSLPVITMTAYAKDYRLEQAFNLGTYDYMEKPLSASTLIYAVERALGREKIAKKKFKGKIKKHRARLLIVDDDERIRKSLEDLLSFKNFDVETIDSAIKALELLEEKTFDLVITDIKMPEMDGLEFIEKVRENHENLPCITITGHGTDYNALDAFHKGAWDFIQKPFHPKDILLAIERALEKRQLNLDKTELIKEQAGNLYELEKMFSELKSMEAQLIQTGKLAALGQLGAGISHEINQPLTIIKGYCQILLKKTHASEEEIDSLHRSIDKEVNRIAEIVNNVRKFAGTERRLAEPHDINNPIRDALMLFRQDFKNRSIRVIESLDSKLPKVKIKRTDLQQVIMNLLLNARDSIEENGNKGDGVIKVSSYRKKDGSILIEISDNGIGMTKQVQAQVFNPFFTTKEVGKGMGLGLSLSYGIINNLGGKIRVKSKHYKGARFTIILPTTEEEDKKEKKAA